MDLIKRIDNIQNNLGRLLQLLIPNCSNQLEVTNFAGNFNSLVEISKQYGKDCPERVKILYDSYLDLIKASYPEMYVYLEKELSTFPSE